MINALSLLNAADCDFGNIVKCVIYLNDMKNFALVNEEYAKFFNKDDYPSRVCIGVNELPKKCIIVMLIIL